MSDMDNMPSGETPSELDSYGVWVKPPKDEDIPVQAVPADSNKDSEVLNTEVGEIDLSDVAAEDDETGDEISEFIIASDDELPEEEPLGKEKNEEGASVGETSVESIDKTPDAASYLRAPRQTVGHAVPTSEALYAASEKPPAIDIDAMPDGEVSLDDFMSDDSGASTGISDGEVSLDAFMDSGDSGGGSPDGEVSLDDFMSGGDGDISLDDFMGEGFSAEQNKKEEPADEPPLEMDLSFNEEPLETVESDGIGVDIEDVSANEETGEDTSETNEMEEMNLDGIADVGDMFDVKDDKESNKAASVSIGESEEVDLSDFGIDANAEETAVTSNVEENRGKVKVVDYDLTVSTDDDVAAAPVVSEVPQGKGQVQDASKIAEDNAALLGANDVLKQIATSLTSLQDEISNIKREMAEMKEHGIVPAVATSQAAVAPTELAKETDEMPQEETPVREETPLQTEEAEISAGGEEAEEPPVEAESAESDGNSEGFFSDDESDDAIALSGDELSNMMSNAVVDEESVAEPVSEESAPAEESGETDAGEAAAEESVEPEEVSFEESAAAEEDTESAAEESEESAEPVIEENVEPVMEESAEPVMEESEGTSVESGVLDRGFDAENAAETNAATEAIDDFGADFEEPEAAEDFEEREETVLPEEISLPSADDALQFGAVSEPPADDSYGGEEEISVSDEGKYSADDVEPAEDFSTDFAQGNGIVAGDAEPNGTAENLSDEITLPSESDMFEEPSVAAINDEGEDGAESTDVAESEDSGTAINSVNDVGGEDVEETAIEEETVESAPITSVNDIVGGEAAATDATEVSAEETGNAAEETGAEVAENSAETTEQKDVSFDEPVIAEETVAENAAEDGGEVDVAEELTADNLDYLNSDAPLDEEPPLDVEPLQADSFEGAEPTLGIAAQDALPSMENIETEETAGEAGPASEEAEAKTEVAEESTAETLDTGESEANENTAGSASSLPSGLQGEVKAVLMYMDELLESLPEDKIAEFARSEQFATYKKLFEELGLS